MEFRVTLALVIAGIVIIAVWYINGALVTPIMGGDNINILVCVKASGCAPELEYTVSGLLWLIENGTINGNIFIIDDAMEENTKKTADMLANDDSRVKVGKAGDIWTRNES